LLSKIDDIEIEKCRLSVSLPPTMKAKVLLLDMDETLVHVIQREELHTHETEPSFLSSFEEGGVTIETAVFVRPGLLDFLEAVSAFF